MCYLVLTEYVYLGMKNTAHDVEVEYLRKQIVEKVLVIEDKEKLEHDLARLEEGELAWAELNEEDLKAIAESDEDVKAGRVRDAFEHLAEIKAKYDIR